MIQYLKFEDLKIMRGQFYWRSKKVEISFESCLNGYCVGVYRLKDFDLISEKRCTNLERPEFHLAINKALEIANELGQYFLKEHFENTLDYLHATV